MVTIGATTFNIQKLAGVFLQRVFNACFVAPLKYLISFWSIVLLEMGG
jgi:hypothetical protein